MSKRYWKKPERQWINTSNSGRGRISYATEDVNRKKLSETPHKRGVVSSLLTIFNFQRRGSRSADEQMNDATEKVTTFSPSLPALINSFFNTLNGVYSGNCCSLFYRPTDTFATTTLAIIAVFLDYLRQFLIDLHQIYRHSSVPKNTSPCNF